MTLTIICAIIILFYTHLSNKMEIIFDNFFRYFGCYDVIQDFCLLHLQYAYIKNLTVTNVHSNVNLYNYDTSY